MAVTRRPSWRHLASITGVVGVLLLVSSPLTWILADGVGPVVWIKVLLGSAATAVGVVAWRTGATSDTRSSGLLAVTVGSTLVAIVLLVAVNYAAWRRPVQWDVTVERIHSLSPQTREVLDELGTDVRILAFLGRDEPRFRATAERLARYDTASERVTVELIEPRLSPERVEQFQIRSDDSRLVVVADGREARPEDGSEQAITSAIVQATDAHRPEMFVLTGHGEGSLDDTSAEGFSGLRRALQMEGYAVRALTLLASSSPDGELVVPSEARVLMILGSRGELLEGEIAALESFLGHGGAIIAALEPGRHSGIETLLATWKIRPRSDVVADVVSQRLGLGWAGPIVQPSSTPHPITERLVNPAVMMTARSLDLLQGGIARIDVVPLLQSGPSAWSEGYPVDVSPPQPDGGELRGPLVVGALAQHDTLEHGHPDDKESPRGGRLVVFGDVDWLSNGLLGQRGNLDLFLNTVGWLFGRGPRVTIPPRSREATELDLRPSDLGMLKLVTMDVVPVLLMAFGAAVVLGRRRS